MNTVDHIRQDLIWTREQLARQLHRIREDASHRLAPLPADADDRAQALENDEVLQRLDENTTTLIGQYQHAIDRLDAGRYGTCERCAYPIEPERLEAVPQATECASCAEERRAH